MASLSSINETQNLFLPAVFNGRTRELYRIITIHSVGDMRCMLMIEKRPRRPKNPHLERLMREFGCTDDCIADDPINDPHVRRQIGNFISVAVQDRTRLYIAGLK